MGRTLVLSLGAGAFVAAGWLLLERGGSPAGEAALVVVLAVLPTLVRPLWGRALALLAAAIVALGVAFDRSPLDVRPFDGRDDFVGPVLDGLRDGILQFYDVNVPFVASARPLMHGTVLIAIFAFSAVIALAVAARRPVLAALALVAGAAWPATLVGGPGLARGAVLLGGVLTLLACARTRPPQTARPALVAGAVLVAAAVAASSSAAVTKSNFLSWQGWDPYDRPENAVGVRYVWNADYDGIRFPKKETVVLTVDAPQRSVYWRATTLDDFQRDHWIEALSGIATTSEAIALPRDPLLPARSRDQGEWVRADVTVRALRDRHLVGPSTPVAYDPNGMGTIEHQVGGVAVVDGGLTRDDRYTVFAYAPSPTPVELARSEPPRPLRNTPQSQYLEITPGAAVPPFGAPRRAQAIGTLIRNELIGPKIRPYVPLYREALRITRGARSPYTAVATLEAWFRSEGGFRYEEQPTRIAGVPPLVSFALETKAGYCQHFAGAMALMLRWLGVPSRVAVGFTSGEYDESEGTWTVTDHNAHAWVEVWFDGWGWLPFDPTPGRGRLSGTYTTAADDFDAQGARRALNLGLGGGPPGFSVLGEFLRSRNQGTTITGRDVPGDILQSLPSRETGSSLLRLLAGLVAAVIGLIAVAKLAIRRGRYVTRDPRRVAAACRAELVDYLADQGVRVGHDVTLAELGQTLRTDLRVDARGFVAAAGAARYAPPDEAPAAARLARRELRNVRRRMRRQLRLLDRARGLLSVRSLGLNS
jgi:transglutaminase-like putative cysteine protease